MVTDLSISVRRRWRGPKAWAGRCAVPVLVAVAVGVFSATADAQKNPRSPTETSAKPSAMASPEATRKQPTEMLFKAVALNDMAAIKASIEAGADLFAENEDGMTAADFAVDKGHFIVAHYLLSRRMLGRTPPVALVPGKAKEAAREAKARPKRKFASPPPKPMMKPDPAPPPMVVAIPKPEAPEEIAAAPAPAGVSPEAPESGGKIEEAPPADAPEAAPETAEAPAPDVAGKPLAEQGVIGFFKRLVDLITPGGEKPPATPTLTAETDIAEAVEPDEATIEPGAEPGAPEDAPPMEDGKETAPDESFVETVVEESDEIVIEVTGDVVPEDQMAGEIVEEVTEDTPLTLVETDLETVTAEPEAQPGKPETKEKPKSFLDRMASLFTTDDKDEAPPAEAGSGPEAAVRPIDVEEYELPLPPPRPSTPKKFSPRFMDKLADFLESGDEEAFNAWLPKTQITNADALRPRATEMAKAEAENDAAALEPPQETTGESTPPVVEKGTQAPVPERAAKPPVERLPLADAPAPVEDGDGEKTGMAETEGARKPAIGKKGMVKGIFNKLVDVLTPDFGSRDRPERLSLEPEEQLAQVEKKAAKDSQAAEPEAEERVPKYWPITEVETAEAPALSMKKRRTPRMKTSLSGVTLSLGRSITLENSYPPGQGGIDPYNRCVKKNRGTTLFCLETVDWPEALQPSFLVPTILYTGQKAIARYDQGIASRFHALFPSESFKRIVQYFHQRFGPPTDAWNRSIAPFAEPRQDNPTLAWRSIDPKTQVVTVLEIRKFDDSRGGFPDTKRGAVMLYLANSPPIFPQVSSHELMRLSRGRLGPPTPPDPAGPPGAPAAAPEGEPKKKAMKDMTAEEIQAERRERKAREAAEKENAAPAAPPGEDSFELPPDPQGR